MIGRCALSVEALAARARLYYGWVIVGALACISMFMGGLAGLNYGLFIPHMVRDLNAPQAFVGLAIAGRSLGQAISGAHLGRLLDRVGPRWLVAGAGLLAGGTVAAQSRATEGWHLIAVMVALGFMGVIGGISLYTQVPLAKWFVRKRGRATSIAFLGAPAGIFLFPPLSQWLIDQYGWRTAWVVLGVTCGLGISVVAALLLRRQPQDLGLYPDGEPAPQEAVAGGPAGSAHRLEAPEVSWTRSEAMRSSTFWKLVVVFGIQMFGFSTMGIFRIPHFIERGVSPEVAALALSAEALASVAASLPAGWAVDRFEHRFAAFGSFVVIEAAFLTTMLAGSTEAAFLSTVLFGMGAASSAVNQNVLWASYFGPAHAGAIRGAALPVTLGFSVVGAPLTGLVHDLTGSYAPAWVVACAAIGVAGLLLVFTPRPSPPQRVNLERAG